MLRASLAGIAVLVLGTATACSNDGGQKGGGSRANNTEDNKAAKVTEVTTTVSGVESYQTVKGASFRVKNYLQLKSAAVSCLAADPAAVGVIRDDMFAAGRCGGGQPGPADGGDRLVILGADRCNDRGKNVYDVLQGQLWSPDLAGRTDTLANSFTPPYAQALASAADVYAHGVDEPASLCDTEDKARTLVARCLAQIPPARLDEAVTAIHGLCSQGAVKAREAIATILGSAAFAAATPIE